MIYDSGFLALYVPFQLYYISNYKLRIFSADGDFEILTAQYGIKMLKNDGSFVIAGHIMDHDPPAWCRLWTLTAAGWSNSNIIRYGYTGSEVYGRMVKLHGSAYITVVNEDLSYYEVANDVSPIIPSRDYELFKYNGGNLYQYQQPNYWSIVGGFNSIPTRACFNNTFLFISVGAILYNHTSEFYNAGGVILDFHVKNEEIIILSETALIFINFEGQLIDYVNISGLTINSKISLSTNFIAINTNFNIKVYQNHMLMYEIQIVTDQLAIIE